MKSENFNIGVTARRVLVAPLDWGLGHATRCIPIIYALLEEGFEVIIAADGLIKILLKNEFPDVVFTELKGYNIRYSNTGLWLLLKLMLQFPKLLLSIYSEHRWLKKLIRKYKIDAVISDNRLGLYHTTIPCIYITHQLKIKTGNSFTAWLVQKIHYFFINKYAACWVPDNEFENDLAGDLSHPQKMPVVPVKYLGPLSRFKKITIEKKYDLMFILSGPEPQRTIFEKMVLEELKTFEGKTLLVRGLPYNEPNDEPVLNDEKKIAIIDHLSSGALNKAIQQSGIIISRSGYTTIMDLIKLQQKAILVPTPGQTEQEYLAAYLMQKKIFYSVLQNNFSLQQALQKATAFSFTNFRLPQYEYKTIVKEFATQVKQADN